MEHGKESVLRAEVHFYAGMLQKLMQWGLTVMVSVQTAIFFVRRELVATYVDAGILRRGQELPYYRYLIGTIFLLACAVVLEKFTRRLTEQYRYYKEQLRANCESGVKDQATTGVTKWIYYLYFAFPAFDILTRLWVEFSLRVAFR